MRVLELFKGTGSISKYYKKKRKASAIRVNFEVVSLDIDKRCNADICCDILDWDYKRLPVYHFDIVWASPECKMYSTLQNTNVGSNRAFKTADELKMKQIEDSCIIRQVCKIISYFKPKHFYIENPKNSKIWSFIPHEFIAVSFIVDYCRFGTSYRKPTRILTNNTKLKHKRCRCKLNHKVSMGFTTPGIQPTLGKQPDKSKTRDRYQIPQRLLLYILK